MAAGIPRPKTGWVLPLAAGLLLGFHVAAHAGDDIEDGQTLFNETCAPCHGRDMSNPGLAADLRKFPHDDASRFKATVLEGKGQGMPAWRGKLSDDDIAVLWAYVQSGG